MSLTLVQQGAPHAAIVHDAAASLAEQRAAAELRDYVARITGATLPIVTTPQHGLAHSLYVTTPGRLGSAQVNLAGLRREGLVIQTVGNDLYLAGADADGVAFTVYAFLERFCGVRWLWPGRTGEVVPRQPTLTVPEIDVREEPDFLWRKFGPGGPLWEQTDKWTKERELGVGQEHQDEMDRWEQRNRLGGCKVVDGHAWAWLIPAELYGQTHPEYFALVNGQRDCQPHDGKHANQLCTSNPELLAEFVRRAREYLDTHEVDVLSISPNDGSGFCECDRCRALDSGETYQRGDRVVRALTDRIFAFSNQVAEQIAESHPDKRLLLLVYGAYITPPKRVRLHDHVIAQFCMHSAAHGNPRIKDRDERQWRGLAQMSSQLGIYEYFINGSWPDLPRVFVTTLADSIRSCWADGCRYYSPQTGDGFALGGPTYYVAAKLLWDAHADVAALLDDYYARGYGPAAQPMRRYYELIEETWRGSGSAADLSDASDYCWLLGVYSPHFLERCRGYLQAARAAADAPEIRERVALAEEGLLYAQLTMGAVAATQRLVDLGLRPFPVQAGLDSWPQVSANPQACQFLDEALQAWEERDRYVEAQKQGFALSFFWIKYNDGYRHFNPVKTLRAIRALTQEG